MIKHAHIQQRKTNGIHTDDIMQKSVSDEHTDKIHKSRKPDTSGRKKDSNSTSINNYKMLRNGCHRNHPPARHPPISNILLH